jgi:hypothetical protein
MYTKIGTTGYEPNFVLLRYLPKLMSATNEAMELFSRDNDIDAADREILASRIKNERQLYLPEEREMLDLVSSKLLLSSTTFVMLPSPDPRVTMELAKKDGNEMRGTCVVDASVETCAAWWLHESRLHKSKDGLGKDFLDRTVVSVNKHSSEHHFVRVVPHKRKSRPRESYTRSVWRWDEGQTGLRVVFDSVRERSRKLRSSTSLHRPRRYNPPRALSRTRTTASRPRCRLSCSSRNWRMQLVTSPKRASRCATATGTHSAWTSSALSQPEPRPT